MIAELHDVENVANMPWDLWKKRFTAKNLFEDFI
jgi:hypothetical protein